jgi:ComF family protein
VQRIVSVLQRAAEDVVAAVWPGVCRRCRAELPCDGVPVPDAARPYAALWDGALRRQVAGAWSVPAWFVCPECACELEPSLAPQPLPGARGLECITAFAPGPVIFDLVHALKYESQTVLATWFAGFLADSAKAHVGPGAVLLPVPLHASRERERGFNQSALLARAVAARIDASVAEGVLVRTRPTAPQAKLPHDDRARNVAGAFGCAGRVPPHGRLVLVDDVVTTGATVGAALTALDVPPERVCVLTLCRARDAAAGAAVRADVQTLNAAKGMC